MNELLKSMKVAAIPDKTRIISNVGKKTFPQLKIGTKIEVYQEIGEILDPKNGKLIDTYGETKEKLIITNLYDNYFIARKVRRKQAQPSFDFGEITPLLLGKTSISFSELNVNLDEVWQNKSEIEPTIQIGDSIRIYHD